jgi:TrmH family RNA methyltransferase
MKIKKYQKDFDYSYTLGAFPTIELLSNRPKDVTAVYYSKKGRNSDGFARIEKMCGELGVEFEEDERTVSHIGRDDTYFLGVFRKYRSSFIPSAGTVLLYQPSDAGNLGTIMRTCVGFGVYNVAIILPAVDMFDPKVIRSSMGAVFSLHVGYFKSVEEYISETTESNMYLFDVKGKEDIDEVIFQRPVTLVFGNEGAGLPDDLLSLGKTVVIPHSKKIDSLNLSVSVGIALHNYHKQG